jgi:hypothetical protein
LLVMVVSPPCCFAREAHRGAQVSKHIGSDLDAGPNPSVF